MSMIEMDIHKSFFWDEECIRLMFEDYIADKDFILELDSNTVEWIFSQMNQNEGIICSVNEYIDELFEQICEEA